MSNEARYSVTVKVNGDLFTVRGDDAEEFAEHLRAAVTHNLVTYVEALQEVARTAAAHPTVPAAVAQAFPGAQVVSDTAANPFHPGPPQHTQAQVQAPQAQVQAAPQQAPQAAPAAGPGAAPGCEHGNRVWREGVSKSSGKPYRGWFCPSMDRGNQCKPIFGAI